MRAALVAGLQAAWRCRALVALLLAVNLGAAGILAVPFAAELERELYETESAAQMARGFDFPWWSHWSDQQQGYAAAFKPDIFGLGFAFRNTDLLLKGELPARLFAPPAEEPAASRPKPELDGTILALGAAYLLLQVFFSGGILAALRSPRGGFTVRGFAHSCGFYFGRMLRLSLLALLADALLFRLSVPASAWVAARAAESVSETTALSWWYGRSAALLFGILLIHMLAGYARAITVLEERKSASLAFVSAIGFCLGRLPAVFGHYLSVALLAAATLAAWVAFDGAFTVAGWGTQALAFMLMQGFVLGRLGLRLALAGGQLQLYRGVGPSQ